MDLFWLGRAPGEHAATATVSLHHDGSAGPQLGVLHIGDNLTGDHLERLGDLTDGSRAVFLADVPPIDAAMMSIADTLSSHGWQLLHVVLLEDAASISALAGISAQRVQRPFAGDDVSVDLVKLNRALLLAPDGDSTGSRIEVRNALTHVIRALEQSHQLVEDQAKQLAAADEQLAAADERISAMTSSARWQIGTAAVEVARNPLRGSRGALRRLRMGWQARSRDSAAPQRSAGRWLDFSIPLPTPPGHQPRAVCDLHFSLPSTYYVARLLKQRGVAGYEPAMLPWFLALCDRAKPGGVWDVGANLGIYALLARAYTDRDVVGFEPTPDIAAWGRRIATENGLAYKLEQFAAGESVGTAVLYLSNSTDSSNSLSEGFRPSTRQVEVLVEPLDRYAARTRSQPAILKIDTETTEHLVLRGAAQVVAANRPWIFCEVLRGRAPERVLTDIMQAHGYHLYHLDGSLPLVERDTVVGDPNAMNYLFAPDVIDDDLTAAARVWADALQG